MLTSLFLAWLAQAAAAPAHQAASLLVAPRRLDAAASSYPDAYDPYSSYPDPYDPYPSNDPYFPNDLDSFNPDVSFAPRDPIVPAVAGPPPPPYPPLPAGGYDARLLCPPNTLHLNLDYAAMLAVGATPAGPCWDLSAVNNLDGLFRSQVPPAAIEFEYASGITLGSMFLESNFNQRLALTGLGNVDNTRRMFQNARLFNSPLSLEGLGSTGKWVNMESMFWNAFRFNQPIDNIGDTSAVTNLRGAFYGVQDFNQPVTVLNTSSATIMTAMFRGASRFNQPVANFVTTKVVDFGMMFSYCDKFNQPIGGWDTSSATVMSHMFASSRSFDQPLNDWDTSQVTSMKGMFGSDNAASGSRFDQPLDQWDTARVTDMSEMFNLNYVFDQELAAWDVAVVSTFVDMFKDSHLASAAARRGSATYDRACRMHLAWKANLAWDPTAAGMVGFDAASCELASPPPPPAAPPTPTGGYDPRLLCPPQRAEIHPNVDFANRGAVDDGVCLNTTMVTTLGNAFIASGPFDGPVQFDAGIATSAEAMFQDSAIDQAISLDLGRVTSTHLMFNRAASFNSPLSLGLSSQWTAATWMFAGARSFNQPLDLGDSSSVTNCMGMFSGAGLFNQPVTTLDTASARSLNVMLLSANAFNQPVAHFDTGLVTDFTSMFNAAVDFNQPVPFDTSSATTFENMFANTNFNQPVSFDTSSATNFNGMFQYNPKFNQPLNFNTSSATSFFMMFRQATSFNQPVNFDTSSAITFEGMFYNTNFNQPVNFDTSSAVSLKSMFLLAKSFNQPVNFDTSSVIGFQNTFNSATNFNKPLAWDTSSAVNMNWMLKGTTSFNQPLVWDTSSVTEMHGMFEGASAFAQELEVWDVSSVTNFANMFQNSRMASEAVSGGRGFGRACRLHHSWNAQNAGWDPVTAGLVADAAELDLSLCAPYLAGGALQGDPHLGLAHGGKADFRGCDGCLFNFLSTRDVTVNARLRASTFALRGSEVHGTFVTEVHVATLDRATHTWFKASYWAEEVGEGNWGWKAVNGSCGGKGFPLYPHSTRACGASGATTAHSSAVFALPEWEVSTQSRPVFDRIEGPKHRLDLSLRPLLPEARLAEWPHGLIGQSFDGDARPRQGKEDDYSTPVVWTTAQAEGAIEGVTDDYRVASPFATEFRFSRFDPLPSGARGPAPVAPGPRAGAPAQSAADAGMLFATAGDDA